MRLNFNHKFYLSNYIFQCQHLCGQHMVGKDRKKNLFCASGRVGEVESNYHHLDIWYVHDVHICVFSVFVNVSMCVPWCVCVCSRVHVCV